MKDLEKLESKYDLPILKIDPHNIAFSLKNLDSARIDYFLIDFNDTCNADCVYCPNLRSKKRIELEQFKDLLTRCEHIGTLQFGCGQEPTADMRLPDFYRVLHISKLRPERLTMITNATLLHRHDIGLFRDCGLNLLQVSLDTVDHEINAMTRRGTEVSRIVSNLQIFREKCPEVEIAFSVVINSLTIAGAEALIDFGDSLGVSHYCFREVFDHLPPTGSSRNNDYRDWMKKITLKPGEFQKLQNRLSHHPSVQKISFVPAERLDSVGQKMRESDMAIR
jgi:molybdenum cofactor biosynthesis enzyme MoaA